MRYRATVIVTNNDSQSKTVPWDFVSEGRNIDELNQDAWVTFFYSLRTDTVKGPDPDAPFTLGQIKGITIEFIQKIPSNS